MRERAADRDMHVSTVVVCKLHRAALRGCVRCIVLKRHTVVPRKNKRFVSRRNRRDSFFHVGERARVLTSHRCFVLYAKEKELL